MAEAHKFEEDQNEAQEIFETTTRELAERVDEMSALSNMSKTAEIAKTVERLHTDLKNAQGHAVTFNSREGVFGKKATDYSNIRATRDAFDPFYKFWTYARDWQTNKNRWWTEPFAELDAETMEATVSDAFKVMFKMGKAFTTRKLPQNAANCEAIRKELDEFQKFVPLCLALRSPGMRDRHWEKISADTGLTVPRAGTSPRRTRRAIWRCSPWKSWSSPGRLKKREPRRCSKSPRLRGRSTPSRPPSRRWWRSGKASNSRFASTARQRRMWCAWTRR